MTDSQDVMSQFVWEKAMVSPSHSTVMAILQSGLAAVSQARTYETALKHLLQIVCTQTEWFLGEVWLPHQDSLHHSGIWYANRPELEKFEQASIGLLFKRGEGLPGRVWQTGTAEWITDVSHCSLETFCRRDLALHYGCGAGVAIPVVVAGQVLTVLVFFMGPVKTCDLEQVHLLEAIAAPLGNILQLKHTETKLREHQQQLRRLVDTLPGIVFTAKGPPDWKMRSLSRGCKRLTGYSHTDLVQPEQRVSYNDITHPADLSRVLDTIQAALSQGKTYEVEYRIITRTGQEKWVWEKGQGIFVDGTPQGLEGFITEITSLKEVEAALKESEMRYRLLAERSLDLISQHDLAGNFCYVSPACRTLLGYEPAAMLGQPASHFFHPADQGQIKRHYRQFLRHKTVQTLRFRIRHQNGDYRWFETISCIVDHCVESGERQVLAVSRDVTERVQVEEALIEREQFLSLVLDSIPQQLFWKDAQGVYLGCNQAFAEKLGLLSPKDVIGKTDPEIAAYSAARVAYFRQQDHQVITQDKPLLNVIEPQAGTSQGWVSCSKFPIHNSTEQVIGVLGSLEDVTDRLNFQRTLERREQYLTALVELQRELLDFDGHWDRDRYSLALQPLGIAAEASRVYVYELRSNEPAQVDLKAQWTAFDPPSTDASATILSFSIVGPARPWLEALQQGYYINQTVEEFPPDLQSLLPTPPINIQSILLLPLMVQGKFSGAVGFSNCDISRRWSRSEVALLQVAANAIAIATERYQVKASLQAAEMKYRSIVENAVEGIFQTTPHGRYVTVNPMLAKIYGYDSPQDLMESLTDIQRQLYVDPNRRATFIHQMLDEGAVIGFESAVYKKDGTVIWISESARATYNDRGQVIGFEGTVEDISDRKRAEMELHRRDRLLQGVAQASQQLLTNPDLDTSIPKMLAILGNSAAVDRIYIYENHPHPATHLPAMSMRYEWTQADIAASIDQPHWQNQSYAEHGLNRWYRAFQAGQSICGFVQSFPPSEQALLARDHILSIIMVPIFIDQDLWGHIGFDACRTARHWTPGEESILVTIAASIGGALKRRHTQEQMRYQAFHDPLTGLPNRLAFSQYLPQSIAQAKQHKTMLAVMFLDLDRFKNINDTLGHAVGDKLLVQVTQRLSTVLRQNDMLARWGGDEFILTLQNLNSVQEAEASAQRLGSSLKPPFLIEQQELYITSSIGIAIHPGDGDDVTTLLQNADAAMYSAKAEGRNTYRFYTSTLKSEASQQLALEKHLHQALQRHEFKLFFQPQIDVEQGQIGQIEALIRWHSPELGWVLPIQFIPVAEEIGLITELGDWVLKQACLQLQSWHQQGFDTLRIAVNLSARQLQQPSLVANIKSLLQGLELSPCNLEIEITETVALSDLEASITTLNQLRQLGTHIVMDDFGTGYSSLSYLKRLPFHGLKIDQTFVQDVPDDVQDVAMLRAMIALGQELQLTTVAEGVETPEQVMCLRELGCTTMQGYWFSQPLDGQGMTRFLQRHWPFYNAEKED